MVTTIFRHFYHVEYIRANEEEQTKGTATHNPHTQPSQYPFSHAPGAVTGSETSQTLQTILWLSVDLSSSNNNNNVRCRCNRMRCVRSGP